MRVLDIQQEVITKPCMFCGGRPAVIRVVKGVTDGDDVEVCSVVQRGEAFEVVVDCDGDGVGVGWLGVAECVVWGYEGNGGDEGVSVGMGMGMG